MAKKLYEEGSVQAIADAIRAKNGSSDKYTVAEMSAAISELEVGGTVQSVQWYQCPELPRKFVEEVTYDPADYSVSGIGDYAPATAVLSNYKPIGKTVGDKTFYNEIPNVETPFVTEDVCGTVKPLDQLRYINTPSAPNVRDLGGWKCDGGTVKYGLLFRGGIPLENDRAVLVEELGVRHDLNLLGMDESFDDPNAEHSPLGTDIHYTRAEDYIWYTLTKTSVWKKYLRCVFDAVTHNEPVYFHCGIGADRTGTVACILEGLLGVSQSDIDKDYELTSFYTGTATEERSRRRNESDWQALIGEINAKAGFTFRDKCVTFAAELGFTADEINAYRTAMIDGTPESVVPDLTEMTVTSEIADGVSIDNAAATVVQYQPYEANIRCAEGRTINSVKVTMDGEDITGQVWTGKKTELYHWVRLNLSGCSSSNESLKAINGQSYATYITAENGYTLSGAEIRILMGGNDVSNYYSGGVIAIPNVTGDITITVTALDAAPNYTNLFDKSNAILNQRYDGNGAEVDGTGYVISPTLVSIPTSEDGNGSFTIRIAGLTTDHPSTNLLRMVWRNTSGNIANGGITYVSFTKDSSGVMVGSCVALKPSYGTMCTFSLNLTRGVTAISESDIENIVVTFNEEI